MPLLSRWYAFVPWIVVMLLVWRGYGWRRALAVALGGWLIAFGAEWASTAGPGIPFGAYAYRGPGLLHDWRILGVPLFDSLSFTWLAFCTYVLTGVLGARGARRLVLAALAMVAIDVVVDPVALRGASWWLGSIYSYPRGAGVWYGVSALNYLGWLVVGLALQLWLALWLSGPRDSSRTETAISALLVAGVMVESAVLAVVLGIAPSAVVAVVLLAGLAVCARGIGSLIVTRAEPAVLVACALASEARAVRRALGPGWVVRPTAGFRRWSRRRDPKIEVWETGLGMAAAAGAASRAPVAAAILVAGVGGATSSGWTIGSVGVASRVLDQESRWWQLDVEIHDRLVTDGVGHSASLASRNQATDGDVARAELAAAGVDIVDMETAAWAQSQPARPHRPTLTALRSVVDTPTMQLGVAAALIEAGATSASPLRILQLLILRPGSLRQLRQLQRRQRLALISLGQAVSRALLVLERLPVMSQDRDPGERPATSPAASP
ncbi:MAG: carotenoid biosynthesis protein [Candidatus Dormiibacterota bacterium]